MCWAMITHRCFDLSVSNENRIITVLTCTAGPDTTHSAVTTVMNCMQSVRVRPYAQSLPWGHAYHTRCKYFLHHKRTTFLNHDTMKWVNLIHSRFWRYHVVIPTTCNLILHTSILKIRRMFQRIIVNATWPFWSNWITITNQSKRLILILD